MFSQKRKKEKEERKKEERKREGGREGGRKEGRKERRKEGRKQGGGWEEGRKKITKKKTDIYGRRWELMNPMEVILSLCLRETHHHNVYTLNILQLFLSLILQ